MYHIYYSLISNPSTYGKDAEVRFKFIITFENFYHFTYKCRIGCYIQQP